VRQQVAVHSCETFSRLEVPIAAEIRLATAPSVVVTKDAQTLARGEDG